MNDENLVSCVADGDRGALETLYDRYVHGCYALALKIVRDPHIAEEIVQDVFVKLWQRPTSFSPQRGKFSAWLMALVHNRAIDKLRQEKKESNFHVVAFGAGTTDVSSLVDLVPDTSRGPYDQAWANSKGKAVRDALEQLRQPQRQALTLAYFEGMTQKEIAERLHEPLGTIKTRTRSALEQLRHVATLESVRDDPLA